MARRAPTLREVGLAILIACSLLPGACGAALAWAGDDGFVADWWWATLIVGLYFARRLARGLGG